ADFGTPMIIGEGFRVLATLIYTEFVNEFGGNPRVASTLSVMLLAVTIRALLLQRAWAKRTSYGQEAIRPLSVYRLSPVGTALAALAVYGIVFSAFLPPLTICVSSFLKSQGPMLLPAFTLAGFRLGSRLPLAFRNTLLF